MAERAFRRAMARKLYDKFSAMWRRDLRLQKRYGKPGSRKPRFSDWWTMHLKELRQMERSTPADVQEYLGDPWAEAPAAVEPEEPRVLTIPIMGDDK